MLYIYISMFLATGFNTIGILAIVAFVTPFFLCALIPLWYLYHYMQQVHVCCLFKTTPSQFGYFFSIVESC